MVKIVLRAGETIEQALRRFNREVLKEGILVELKKREFYEKPSAVKRREKEARERRIQRYREFFKKKK